MLRAFRMYNVIRVKAILNQLCIISAAEIRWNCVYNDCFLAFIRNPWACSDFLEKHINPQNSKRHHVSKNSSFKCSFIQAVTSQIMKPNCNLLFFLYLGMEIIPAENRGWANILVSFWGWDMVYSREPMRENT